MSGMVKVVGIGGSARPGSTAEKALRITLAEADRLGAHVSVISGADLAMPLYDPREGASSPQAVRMLAEVADADGIVLASPAYHGTVSGLVKNALDHIEELNDGDRPYFTGRAVGCLAVGMGWQGAVNTLGALRGVVHALRGWPTPLGVAVNTETVAFTPDGSCSDPRVTSQLTAMAAQIVAFAEQSARTPSTPAPTA